MHESRQNNSLLFYHFSSIFWVGRGRRKFHGGLIQISFTTYFWIWDFLFDPDLIFSSSIFHLWDHNAGVLTVRKHSSASQTGPKSNGSLIFCTTRKACVDKHQRKWEFDGAPASRYSKRTLVPTLLLFVFLSAAPYTSLSAHSLFLFLVTRARFAYVKLNRPLPHTIAHLNLFVGCVEDAIHFASQVAHFLLMSSNLQFC